MQEKTSAVVICQNEEKKIPSCLESIKWADEIVIVDAFSKDSTVSICRNYTQKIFQREWTNYPNQLEFAISKASYDRVIFIDADERISPELHKEIIQVLNSEAGKNTNGYYIPRRTYYNNKLLKNWGKSYTLRIIKKSKIMFDHKEELHEKIIVAGKTTKLKNYIEHYTYDNLVEYFDKFNKYTTALAKQLYKNKNISMPILILKMIFGPIFIFLKKFFLRFGFIGGLPVLIMSIMSAVGKFVVYVKYWELKTKL